MADRLTTPATNLELRPATADDRELLLGVYASTRADELSLVPWTDAEKAAFVEQQFSAQDADYRQVYPDGRFDVVELDGRPVGRCYAARLADELRLIDVTLLPAERGRGIGSTLLANLCTEADSAGLPIRLHVEPWNPARRLYLRFGFQTLEMRAIHEFMERPPTVARAARD